MRGSAGRMRYSGYSMHGFATLGRLESLILLSRGWDTVKMRPLFKALVTSLLFVSALPVGMKISATSVDNQLTREQAECIIPSTGSNAAQDNYERIQYCLDTYGIAKLDDGVFYVNHQIDVGNGDVLAAVNVTWPSIVAAAPVNCVLNVCGDNANVSLIQIDYNQQYIAGSFPCKSVVGVTGNNNFISNCFIRGGSSPQTKNAASENDLKTITGVYFANPPSMGNTVYNCKIYNATYGVIFVAGITKNAAGNNKLDNCEIYYNRSDGITLCGYGEVVNSTIHHNGFDCLNGVGTPIPGANIYALDNRNGALIKNNILYDSNGSCLDIAECRDFVIDSNTIYDPGCRSFPSATDYSQLSYSGGYGLVVVDTQESLIQGNLIENNRNTNKVGSFPYTDAASNRLFCARGAASYSDLPSGSNQVIAFVLAEFRGTTKHTTGNIIRGNDYRSAPSGNGAVGLGLFVSRGTGFGVYGQTSDDVWSATTTNYFRGNSPFGSHIGSIRCGGNWYAADGVEPNQDDDQHLPPNSDWAGNDFKSHY